jgi:hypothetical protein
MNEIEDQKGFLSFFLPFLLNFNSSFSQNCEEKKVTDAYHILCTDCVKLLKVCAKCRVPFEEEKYVKYSFGSLARFPPTFLLYFLHLSDFWNFFSSI